MRRALRAALFADQLQHGVRCVRSHRLQHPRQHQRPILSRDVHQRPQRVNAAGAGRHDQRTHGLVPDEADRRIVDHLPAGGRGQNGLPMLVAHVQPIPINRLGYTRCWRVLFAVELGLSGQCIAGRFERLRRWRGPQAGVGKPGQPLMEPDRFNPPVLTVARAAVVALEGCKGVAVRVVPQLAQIGGQLGKCGSCRFWLAAPTVSLPGVIVERFHSDKLVGLLHPGSCNLVLQGIVCANSLECLHHRTGEVCRWIVASGFDGLGNCHPCRFQLIASRIGCALDQVCNRRNGWNVCRVCAEKIGGRGIEQVIRHDAPPSDGSPPSR